MPFVYRISNSISGKLYIGICNSKVRRRWRRHCNSAAANKPRNRNCPALHAAIRKYGEAAFLVETLYEAVDWRESCMVERGLIAQYGTLAPKGYNLTSGGEGRLGSKVSEEAKRKSSERALGHPLSPVHRKKIGESQLGKTLSPEHVELIRQRSKKNWQDPEFRRRRLATIRSRPKSEVFLDAQKQRWRGKKHSVETRKKMSAWQVGKKLSEETKRKIAAKATGRKKTAAQIKEMQLREFTPEHREKISTSLKGRAFTPEWRAKISAGLKRRWARAHEDAN